MKQKNHHQISQLKRSKLMTSQQKRRHLMTRHLMTRRRKLNHQSISKPAGYAPLIEVSATRFTLAKKARNALASSAMISASQGLQAAAASATQLIVPRAGEMMARLV